MTERRFGLKEEVGLVMEEIMKAMEFDMDNLSELTMEEIETMVFEAVLSVIDQEEVPFIDWIRLVEKEEADEFRDEKGDFMVN